jgi:hypothetical protein
MIDVRRARRDLTRRLRLTRRSSAVGYRVGRARISALKEHADATPAQLREVLNRTTSSPNARTTTPQP